MKKIGPVKEATTQKKREEKFSKKLMKARQVTDEFGGYSKQWFTTQESGVEQQQASDAAGDLGMDGITKALGLDINAIAKKLALLQDGSKPIQIIDMNEDEDMHQEGTQEKTEKNVSQSRPSPISKINSAEPVFQGSPFQN